VLLMPMVLFKMLDGCGLPDMWWPGCAEVKGALWLNNDANPAIMICVSKGPPQSNFGVYLW